MQVSDRTEVVLNDSITLSDTEPRMAARVLSRLAAPAGQAERPLPPPQSHASRAATCSLRCDAGNALPPLGFAHSAHEKAGSPVRLLKSPSTRSCRLCPCPHRGAILHVRTRRAPCPALLLCHDPALARLPLDEEQVADALCTSAECRRGSAAPRRCTWPRPSRPSPQPLPRRAHAAQWSR
jgi:hypothetical protein